MMKFDDSFKNKNNLECFFLIPVIDLMLHGKESTLYWNSRELGTVFDSVSVTRINGSFERFGLLKNDGEILKTVIKNNL